MNKLNATDSELIEIGRQALYWARNVVNNGKTKPLCKICNEKEAFESYAHYEPEMVICGACAEKAANSFWKAHSGKWLTRPNPPAQPRSKDFISKALRKSVFERDAYRCQHCGDHKDLCADHIHPESKGGQTVLENLQTLCRSCNSKKGTKV